ncbi:hypothetical protein RclHR1_00110004 [Rhizophagus clarus]|nr:hypothetical protein RclHR1_00110004 [Rhizophagus clarus]
MPVALVTHKNNATISDQQPMSSVDNNRQYDGSNNISHQHNYQQSICYNNVSPPQFYPQHVNQNQQNPPQSNIFLSFNSFNITINSPQVNIIIIPPTKPDINIKFEPFCN